MRRTLLLAGGGLTIAGAFLPWVELHVDGLSAKHGLGVLALAAGALAVFAALLDDGAAVSILASVAAAGAAAAGTWRVLHSTAYEVATERGIPHWEAGLGLWAMGLGAASALAALLTASD